MSRRKIRSDKKVNMKPTIPFNVYECISIISTLQISLVRMLEKLYAKKI